ncbi:MAG: 30S ribosomal protein S5 [Candidatus Pacebacteria bacterium]|nr:30S ribosomal protein S5 [Candidatus Paceibacterota bacterium]MDD4201343.1 30S ribosomal protein S5 [Candidatus Paceibacterota bacterium]MDD4897156.1 30S ribosomal protein S5 [Candidatus Paceibacterota bacterium]
MNNFTRKPAEKKDNFDSKLLDLTRVVRMTGGGRKFRFRATVIVGNYQGLVGMGIAKGKDVAEAIEKATKAAKKNIIQVPILKDTIAHQVESKFKAAKVVLKPQSKGRGVVAGGTVRVICNLAGIKNISSKIIGKTNNKINNANAAISALKKLKNKNANTRTENQK